MSSLQGLINYLAGGNSRFQLAGRGIEDIVAFNALAITSTTAQFSAEIDLSKYRQVFWYAFDSHNQDIALNIVLNGMSYREWTGSAWAGKSAAISEDSRFLNLQTVFDKILDKPLKSIKFQASATVAPTSGSLTVKGWGVPN